VLVFAVKDKGLIASRMLHATEIVSELMTYITFMLLRATLSLQSLKRTLNAKAQNSFTAHYAWHSNEWRNPT